MTAMKNIGYQSKIQNINNLTRTGSGRSDEGVKLNVQRLSAQGRFGKLQFSTKKYWRKPEYLWTFQLTTILLQSAYMTKYKTLGMSHHIQLYLKKINNPLDNLCKLIIWL